MFKPELINKTRIFGRDGKVATRLETIKGPVREDVAGLLAAAEAAMGFSSNSLKVMAHRPAVLAGFLGLAGAVLGPDAKLDTGLRQLIAYASSLAVGCQYCQAHTTHIAANAGVAKAKLAVAWDYERSDLFTDAERAAMAFAQSASAVPNTVSDDDFEALKKHYSTEEIVEILAVVSLFGFLNRWNDSLSTTLEEHPADFAANTLAAGGWSVGKHAP